jgi:hypothetical protein
VGQNVRALRRGIEHLCGTDITTVGMVLAGGVAVVTGATRPKDVSVIE